MLLDERDSVRLLRLCIIVGWYVHRQVLKDLEFEISVFVPQFTFLSYLQKPLSYLNVLFLHIKDFLVVTKKPSPQFESISHLVILLSKHRTQFAVEASAPYVISHQVLIVSLPSHSTGR